MNSQPPTSIASRTPGSSSVKRPYQTKSCSSSGTLRITSTYPALNLASSQFDDSRPMPTSVPITVAKNTPSAATVSVLTRPTAKARP